MYTYCTPSSSSYHAISFQISDQLKFKNPTNIFKKNVQLRVDALYKAEDNKLGSLLLMRIMGAVNHLPNNAQRKYNIKISLDLKICICSLINDIVNDYLSLSLYD
jgi:hypothetical protein